MIARYLISCDCARPDWPFIPVSVVCGSARTIGVVGLKSRCGVKVTGCRIRVTNADGEPMTRECVKEDGVYVATFPASHFQNYGAVKNGVVIFAAGLDERGDEQLWIERVGDLKVEAGGASAEPGAGWGSHDIYVKSEIVEGVQHFKREVLAYSERQRAWGAEYVGDYVFSGGDYVPVDGEGE